AGEVSVSAAVDSIRPRPPSAASRSNLPSPAGKALKLTRDDVIGWLSTNPVEECRRVFNVVGKKRMGQMIPPAWSMSPPGKASVRLSILHTRIAALEAEVAALEAEVRERDRAIAKMVPGLKCRKDREDCVT